MTSTPQGVIRGVDGKRSYVRDMFTAIAPRYDLLNHVLSLNIDRRWRRNAISRLNWESAPGGTYLDLCAGTLDLAAELVRQVGFEGEVVGADFVVPMLHLGKEKGTGVRPVGADALELPFPDEKFDGCTVGFGVRNLADLRAGLIEAHRVLRPGARFVILEFGTPKPGVFRALYLWYFKHILPRIGRLVSRHASAYAYLPSSVEGFPEADAFSDLMRGVGFENVGTTPLTFGVAYLYWGDRA
jgi:demethylmenaquinone methyltransferase / 2-methoxy-6-polyprenyl-1,4-benzoquinol methylase